jgi:hypothetical protein
LKRFSNFSSLFDYEPLSTNGIDIPYMKESIRSLVDFVTSLDTIFRVIRTGVILLKIFSRGFVEIPPVDVQSKKIVTKEQKVMIKLAAWIAGQVFMPLLFAAGIFVVYVINDVIP